MKVILRVNVILGLILCCQAGWADSEAPAEPIVTVSENRRCFFKMIPAKRVRRGRRLQTVREAFGAAYRVEDDGQLTELWKTSGWYNFEVLLSNDGKYLVRVGSHPAGSRPEAKDLGVAFYKNGQLLKSYSTAELVKDPRKVMATASHYMWLARASRQSPISTASCGSNGKTSSG